MKDFIKVLLYIWQLPQNLLGLLLFWWYGHDDAIRGEHRRAKVLYSQKMRGGISLGKRIILPLKYAGLSNSYVRLTLDHEWGHTRQSLYLGWLYLPIIGIPSITWAWLHSSFKSFGTISYYSFFTERWADRLGGVRR